MGVYIRGMEMPTNCGDCDAFVCYKQWSGDMGDCFCGITKNDAKAKTKNADCPLVELPPHGRLIDADALNCTMLYKENWIIGAGVEALAVWKKDIDASPTIIEAEEGE